MKKQRKYRWYMAVTSDNSFVNRRIFEQTGSADDKFHPDTKCFDRDGLDIVRDLYGFADRREFMKARNIAWYLRASLQVFVQEGVGKIRQMPGRKRTKPGRSRHLFAMRSGIR